MTAVALLAAGFWMCGVDGGFGVPERERTAWNPFVRPWEAPETADEAEVFMSTLFVVGSEEQALSMWAALDLHEQARPAAGAAAQWASVRVVATEGDMRLLVEAISEGNSILAHMDREVLVVDLRQRGGEQGYSANVPLR